MTDEQLLQIDNLDDFKSVLLNMANDEGLSISSLEVSSLLTMSYEGNNNELYATAREELTKWLEDNNFVLEWDEEEFDTYFITKNYPPVPFNKLVVRDE